MGKTLKKQALDKWDDLATVISDRETEIEKALVDIDCITMRLTQVERLMQTLKARQKHAVNEILSAQATLDNIPLLMEDENKLLKANKDLWEKVQQAISHPLYKEDPVIHARVNELVNLSRRAALAEARRIVAAARTARYYYQRSDTNSAKRLERLEAMRSALIHTKLEILKDDLVKGRYQAEREAMHAHIKAQLKPHPVQQVKVEVCPIHPLGKRALENVAAAVADEHRLKYSDIEVLRHKGILCVRYHGLGGKVSLPFDPHDSRSIRQAGLHKLAAKWA